MMHKIDLKSGVLFLMILIVGFSRLIPHIPNFSPLAAMALFGAAHFEKKWLAFMVPLFAYWLSDLLLNNVLYAAYYPSFTWFYPGFYWQYGSLLLIAALGLVFFKKVNVKTILGSSIAASLLFFLISNFGVWFGGNMYPKDFSGLMACYIAGLPFLKGTFLGDLFYSGVMFGAFSLLQRKVGYLRKDVTKVVV